MADKTEPEIAEIAEAVWRSAHSFAFGEAQAWPTGLFQKGWAEANGPGLLWGSYGKGWYWFLVAMTLDDIQSQARPRTLPKKGCDIGALSLENADIFGEQLLCKTDELGRLVVYNGHQKDVSDRVRRHFALDNQKTGALGLKHYPLHGKKWEVRVFAQPCISSLAHELQPTVLRLMNSATGRRAVETAWRTAHGWPVLCKS